MRHVSGTPESAPGPAGQLDPPAGGRRKRGRRQRGLGMALITLSIVLLAVVGAGSWFYFSFLFKVSAANGKVDTAIQQALDTPPPATLVTVPTTVYEKPDVVMNMLVLGNDARAGVVEGSGSSDVIMLLHIDTRADFLSILSITRDLYVAIPGYGKDRINAAYDHGGPALTIATLKQALGVDVTKYIGVGFEKFPSLIDSLGGVYVDVDRQYTDTPWWKFDLAPGYQLLDGDTALLFSRYRFDENSDFGRMARQQRILTGLRDQARDWDKKLKLPGIVNTIMDTATTNLSAEAMLKLAYWLVRLDSSRTKQVVIEGPGQVINGKSLIVADQATITQAVTDFLTPPPDDTEQAQPTDSVDTSEADAAPLLVAAADPALQVALAASTTTTVPGIRDAAAWKAAEQGVPFSLEAPTALPVGYAYAGKAPAGAGSYGIESGDEMKPAVRVLYRYRKSDLYLGISATTWLEAPLAGDGAVVEKDGVAYTICGTLAKADYVWWQRDGVLYWVSNTLMNTLTEHELLDIAQSMRPVSEAAK